MRNEPTETEREMLVTLAWMCEQYLDENGSLDHKCMSAGERALELLLRYDLVDGRGRGAQWTEAGRRLMNGGWMSDDPKPTH